MATVLHSIGHDAADIAVKKTIEAQTLNHKQRWSANKTATVAIANISQLPDESVSCLDDDGSDDGETAADLEESPRRSSPKRAMKYTPCDSNSTMIVMEVPVAVDDCESPRRNLTEDFNAAGSPTREHSSESLPSSVNESGDDDDETEIAVHNMQEEKKDMATEKKADEIVVQHVAMNIEECDTANANSLPAVTVNASEKEKNSEEFPTVKDNNNKQIDRNENAVGADEKKSYAAVPNGVAMPTQATLSTVTGLSLQSQYAPYAAQEEETKLAAAASDLSAARRKKLPPRSAKTREYLEAVPPNYPFKRTDSAQKREDYTAIIETFGLAGLKSADDVNDLSKAMENAGWMRKAYSDLTAAQWKQQLRAFIRPLLAYKQRETLMQLEYLTQLKKIAEKKMAAAAQEKKNDGAPKARQKNSRKASHDHADADASVEEDHAMSLYKFKKWAQTVTSHCDEMRDSDFKSITKSVFKRVFLPAIQADGGKPNKKTKAAVDEYFVQQAGSEKRKSKSKKITSPAYPPQASTAKKQRRTAASAKSQLAVHEDEIAQIASAPEEDEENEMKVEGKNKADNGEKKRKTPAGRIISESTSAAGVAPISKASAPAPPPLKEKKMQQRMEKSSSATDCEIVANATPNAAAAASKMNLVTSQNTAYVDSTVTLRDAFEAMGKKDVTLDKLVDAMREKDEAMREKDKAFSKAFDMLCESNGLKDAMLLKKDELFLQQIGIRQNSSSSSAKVVNENNANAVNILLPTNPCAASSAQAPPPSARPAQQNVSAAAVSASLPPSAIPQPQTHYPAAALLQASQSAIPAQQPYFNAAATWQSTPTIPPPVPYFPVAPQYAANPGAPHESYVHHLVHPSQSPPQWPLPPADHNDWWQYSHGYARHHRRPHW